MLTSRSSAALVATLLVLASLTAAPAALAADGDPVTFDAGSIPSWHVTVDAAELDTLESWANSSDDRAVLRTHNASNYALIKAPDAAAGKTLVAAVLNRGLAAKPYVKTVRPNLEHSHADPVTLENQSRVETPGVWTTAKAWLGDLDASWSPSGVAFGDDANESTPADVRSVTGVDNVSATGTGATLAVVDTGVNTADGRIFGNGTANSSIRLLNASKDFIENETVSADGLDAVEDPNGHGTWVASAAAANHSDDTYDGIAPDADVLALRALDADGSGSTGDIAAAIRYAADNDADVIVMSLGSPVYDATMTDAIDYAIRQNVSAIAVAAGNSRQTTRWLATPADVPRDGVAAVTATNTKSNATAGVAYFANVGEDPGSTDGSLGATNGQDVTVAAPGMALEAKTATTAGAVTNTTLSGTSMAAPQVAGVGLLGVDAGEDWIDKPDAFVSEIRETARPMPKAAAAEAGAGMVAADRLLENATDGSQQSAMTKEAAARDAFYRGLSETSGRFSLSLLRRLIN